MRTLALPKAAEPWSLTSMREKLIKIGAKVVSHGRYVIFQMAEVAVSRQMFQEILMLVARLRAPPAPAWTGDRVRMRQTTTVEVRLDTGKAKGFGAWAKSTGWFNSTVHAVTDLPLPKTPGAAILSPQPTRNLGNVGLNPARHAH